MIENEEMGHFDPVVLESFKARYDDFLATYAKSHDTEPAAI